MLLQSGKSSTSGTGKKISLSRLYCPWMPYAKRVEPRGDIQNETNIEDVATVGFHTCKFLHLGKVDSGW